MQARSCGSDRLYASVQFITIGKVWCVKRLPAHVRDFDESICIISGEATCIVEGRRYKMADCSMALQPRGRGHYFINESAGPMEMIWVYAGPRPERIVVGESCATPAGDPWR